MNGYVRNKRVYSLIWLAVLAVIAWIVAGTWDKDEKISIQAEQVAEEAEAVNEIIEEHVFFLVKADGESVNVYKVDSQGEHLYKETSIPFSMLSTEDQLLLEEGYRLDSEQEIAGFIENYDS